MIGPPVAGSVFDTTQSYDISFYLAGAFLILAALVNLLVEVMHRRTKTEDSKLHKIME